MNLTNSFNRAELINRQQEEILKEDINKESRIVNSMIQEIMWGSSKSSIKFDARKDYSITSSDADLMYNQALQYIKENRKWYKR